MKTRYLLLPAMLFALGCTVPNDAPTATESSCALEIQPKAEKTKAELLVGKWKLVKRSRPLHPDVTITDEFTADGKVTSSLRGTLPGHEHDTGTYRVDGNMLYITWDRPLEKETREHSVTIETITEDKLIYSAFSGLTKDIYEFERVRER